ncbi:uracil-DNA glycosylase [Yoonia sediminilitoris]|uniref:Type-4 uracil-DNA glycosylase n=1 Tax=Yoonia sediminilitoris TaxID=1286148 RepID=A0A2T6KI92_9RHOB|nr:uracil-DNA glycosylase [Yoonia sediminilitoris]PUB15450.1 DNA polymerase [Yoonia sediminilitoris]RCW96060.1 DNA polymerase [Yoonia sediminilitoris]
MDSVSDYWNDRALLEWQVELGATDAIQDTPIDRYALEAVKPTPKPAVPKDGPPPIPEKVQVDPVAIAQAAATAAVDLDGLAAAMQAFEHCELKRGARNFVFCDGQCGARVMIVGEAPGREEDRAGKPFVGRAGQLLDRMLAAIDLARDHAKLSRAVYITNVMPWRPPSNRAPEPAEIAMMLPFLERHITLADPDIVVLMGNTPCQALLGRTGITRLRGHWTEVLGKPCLPMFHPAYLLRNPAAKREAWADLLALNARLRD